MTGDVHEKISSAIRELEQAQKSINNLKAKLGSASVEIKMLRAKNGNLTGSLRAMSLENGNLKELLAVERQGEKVAKAFHDVAVKQRNAAWVECEHLKDVIRRAHEAMRGPVYGGAVFGKNVQNSLREMEAIINGQS